MHDFLSALGQLHGTMELGEVGRLARVEASWNRVAGEALRRRTKVLGLNNTTLAIAVPDKLWKRNLEQHISEFLFKLNTLLGSKLVVRIEFAIDEGVFAEHTGGELAAHCNSDISVKGLPEETLKAAESIKDPELRGVFLAAASASLNRETME